jgi:hypothetical protein
MVEPRIEAQRLNIPGTTVDRVASELHGLNILHVWARASCPNVEPGEPNTITETDDVKTFQAAITSPCLHCGQEHDELSWENIETFYAIHFEDEPDDFQLSKLLRRKSKSLNGNTTTTKTPWYKKPLGALGSAFVWFKPKPKTPIAAVSRALEQNAPLQQIPAAHVLILKLWMCVIGYALLSIAVSVGAYLVFGIVVGLLVMVALLGMFAVVSYFTIRLITATPLIQKLLIGVGYGLSVLLFAQSRFNFAFSISEKSSWFLHVDSQETDPHSIYGACFLVLITTGGALLHHYANVSNRS